MNDEAALLNAIADALAAGEHELRRRAAELGCAEVHPTAHADAQGDQDVVSRARSIHPMLGPRQAEILTLLHEAGSAGTDTGVLYRRMNYDQSNVYLTLRALIRSDLVVKDATAVPHRYRLSERLADCPSS